VSELVVDGEVVFRLGRDGAELIAEWRDLCTLRCDRAGEHASFVAAEHADPRIVAKVKQGLAAALLRHLRGETTLHASAVARGGEAIAFLGRSGAGKSTLAAFLCRSRAFDLLADDVVRVAIAKGSALAHPTESEHWLESGSVRALGLDVTDEHGKVPIMAPRVALAPVPLRALVALSLDAAAKAPRVARIRGHRALEQLVPCLVRFVIDEPDEQVKELANMAALVDALPFYEVHAPRDFGALSQTARVVEKLFGQGGSQ
jgi:hypothetical protein